MTRSTRYRGVTLIEAVLYISIAMGLIVGGLQFYQQASTALRTEQTVRLATALVAEAHGLYRRGGLPDAAAQTRLDPVLAAAGSVPGTARSDDPDHPVKAPWGAPVTLTAGTDRIDGTAGPLTLHLAFEDMPSTICTRLIHHDGAGTGPLGADVIEAGIVDAADGSVRVMHDTETGGALDPAEAGTLCRQAGDGSRVVLSFAWRSN